MSRFIPSWYEMPSQDKLDQWQVVAENAITCAENMIQQCEAEQKDSAYKLAMRALHMQETTEGAGGGTQPHAVCHLWVKAMKEIQERQAQEESARRAKEGTCLSAEEEEEDGYTSGGSEHRAQRLRGWIQGVITDTSEWDQ